jgi:hypothetical protein
MAMNPKSNGMGSFIPFLENNDMVRECRTTGMLKFRPIAVAMLT